MLATSDRPASRAGWVGRLLSAVAGGIVWLFAFVAAISLLGAFAPDVPIAGVLGLLPSVLGPTILLLLLVIVAIRGRRCLRTRRAGDAALGALALATALGLVVLLGGHMRAAQAAGARIDLLRPLGLWLVPREHASLEPTEETYLRADGEDLHVLVYRPAPRTAPAPVLVYVHGGGWVKFSHRFRSRDMRWFADQGFLVLSVQYSLSSETRHMWDRTQPQVGCALAWVARNASRLGGDPARVAMLGDSAGGNLVLTTAYAAAAGTLRPACAGASPRIAAAVAIYPVIDVAALYGPYERGGTTEGRGLARQYVGGSPVRFPDRYAFVSPGSYATPQAPPTLFLLGQADRLVRAEAARALAVRLTQMGVRTRTIETPYAPHAYDVMPGAISNQLTRQATLHFLAEQNIAP